MNIIGYQNGQRLCPLETVRVISAQGIRFSVEDGQGRVYAGGPTQGEFSFITGGALGVHTVRTHDDAGQEVERAQFLLDARTELDDAGGKYRELLTMLYLTMVNNPEDQTVRFQDQLYFVFVPWLRDHVHVMKGMKYFAARLHDGIDLYRDSQRDDGMIWDNFHRRKPPFAGPDHWSVRFDYGNFFRLFDDCTHEFTRIPVENDVEYLFVEGLYYTWKATGDDAWMAASLPAAKRALEYSITSPYRWSEKFGLLKRGHTIDTWDFQNEEDCLPDFAGWPDPMAIYPGRTRFGIMFGDNTGYAAGCQYLAEMLEHVGQAADAEKYRRRGAEIMERLSRVSWNGQFFTHHVPEDPNINRDLGVDESTQISLSNAYSLNRPITHEQAAAIIRTYMELRERLPEGSPGEWYTIYPPYPKGYGGHNAMWQYMNASVTPIVAGELAHGAFQHGFEQYGADILNRLVELGKQHGGRFHCSYTGAFPQPFERSLTLVVLNGYANASLPDPITKAVGEHPLPNDPSDTAEIPFTLAGNGTAIGLGAGLAESVTIPLNANAGSIYLLHTVSRIDRNRPAGSITLEYANGSTFTQTIISGREVLPWSHWEYWEPDSSARAVWRHPHPQHLNMQLTVYGLTNPHPEREIVRVQFSATENSPAPSWYILGLTISDQPVYFRPGPISYGIPDGWGAAAVVYALVEGLAGVVDEGKTFNRVSVAPRWASAGVDSASATICYPASGGYVRYRYRYEPEKQRIVLDLTGSGEQCALRILLPDGAQNIVRVTVNGSEQEVVVEQGFASHYACVDLTQNVPSQVELTYA